MSQTIEIKHDPSGWRVVPQNSQPLDPHRVEALLAKEWERFKSSTSASAIENARAKKSLPLGVTSSFQHWDPHPISVATARGAYVTDVDGRTLLDLSMGFGAMMVGHLNEFVLEKVRYALENTGTLFVTPSPTATVVAERFKGRFNLDMVRFTNSGTESLMYAIRTARAATGRRGIIKLEGGYHGGYDPLQVSVKPSLANIGDGAAPTPEIPFEVEAGLVVVVPYNNLEYLEEMMQKHEGEIAAFVLEPVMENLSIVLPDDGYLRAVRELCDRFDICLIFDEVKTGLTAGIAGAGLRAGVQPDLVTLAKSIGGGFPVAAFGGKQRFMDAVVDGRMAHYGTYNGNPLVMAAVAAVDELVDQETFSKAEKINVDTLTALDGIIQEFELPAHTVGLGLKGAITWRSAPVRNYRDFKNVDFEAAELSWLWGINRGIITPPGLDEQWLVSLAHTRDDMQKLVQATSELAQALRA